MRSLFLALCALSMAGSVAAQPATDPRQKAVETGLLPAAVFDGKPGRPLEERMARWNTPGVSIAVIDDGRIVWAKGYGVLAVGDKRLVTAETRFQAASISKPVAATAALSLVQDGKLSLDGDVNASLKSWKLPASAFTADRPVTLKDLLSHTGGTTVHGFPGYAQGEPVPTLPQLLSGQAPANTPAVVSEARPGQRWKYSGGGYQIVQQMVEDVTGRPFAAIVRERVLTPARMSDSGYDQPAEGLFAIGHGMDGRPIPGGWHTYPEQAAAGLWTTPTDLARFGLALSAAWRGEPGALLDPATARAMMTPVMKDYGLGPGVEGQGEAMAISHGGSNEGFRAFWVMHPVTGDGVAVMVNGDAGERLQMEIVRAVAKAYGWPDFAPEQYTSVAVSPQVLQARAGVWTMPNGNGSISFTLRAQEGLMEFETFRGTFRFVAVSDTTMRSEDTGAVATFTTDAEGKPLLKVFGMELRRAG